MTARLASPNGRFASVIAAAAIVALLAPALLLAADQRLAAWAPGHGHVGNPLAVATHTHEGNAHTAPADATSDRTVELVFTAAGDASVVTALTLAALPLELPTVGAPMIEAGSSDHAGPVEVSSRVPTPPPQV